MKTDVGALQDLYFELVEDTESPYIFHRWALLTCMGAALSRNVYLPFGGFGTIFPNQYCVLLGTAGSRKSTAIKQATRLLEKAGYDKFASDKTTPEKFIADLAIGFDNIESEELAGLSNMVYRSSDFQDVLIKASELEDFIGPSNSEFISLLTNLWDNLDEYRHRTKSSGSQRVIKPTVSMIGGATPTTFETIFPAKIVSQGMLSRMLVVYSSKPRKKVPFPKPFNPEIENLLVDELRVMMELRGEMKLSEEARETFSSIYTQFEELDDERLESYSSRRHEHLLKLSIIIAASNARLEILHEDLVLANTILTYTENYMSRGLGEFGNTDDSKKYNSVLRIIRKHKDGISAIELQGLAIEAGIGHTKLSEILVALTNLKKIDMVRFNSKPMFVANVKKIKGDSEFIDFNLLLEYRSSGGKMDEESTSSTVDDYKKIFEEANDAKNEFESI